MVCLKDRYSKVHISDYSTQKVLEYIESGKNEGGSTGLGGKLQHRQKRGTLLNQQSLLMFKDYMKIMKEKISGPITYI